MLQQTEVQKSVYTAFRDSPFSLQESVKEVYVKSGSSIQEVIDQSVTEEWQRKYLRVVLNDEVIQPEDYALTFVNEKDVVGMVLVPQNGETGQILKAVAVIAIVIAVTYFTGGTATPLLSPAMAAAAGAAAGLAASLALNSLFPPPVPGLPSTGGGSSGAAEDPVYGFNKTGNSINKYGTIPRIYGRRKVFPQHAIAPFIISKGNNQYLHQIFTAGYGPLQIEDIRIGDMPISNYKDVEYKIHESFVAGDELSIVKTDNWQDAFSIKLLQNSSNTIETADDVNGASLEIQFPQGLFSITSNSGVYNQETVNIQVQCREVGSSTWQALTAFNPLIDNASIDAVVSQNSWTQVGSEYYSNPNYPTVGSLPDASSRGNGVYLTVETVVYYDEGYSYSYVDYVSQYQISATTSNVKVQKKTQRPFFVSIDVSFPSAGKYEFKVIRTTEDREGRESNPFYDTCFISGLRSIKNQPPIAPEKSISLIELKIRATDQLNGAVNNLSCIVTSKLPVWNGAEWSVQLTRNPAWAYLDVMRGSASKKAVSDSKIDLAAFKSWADWCNSSALNDPGQPRAMCDIEITSMTTAWEVMRLIGGTGYASPTDNGGKYSITVDKERDTPVQMFTPRNIKSFSGDISYHVQPHALRISYTQTDSTETDEIIVYDDGYNADGSGGLIQATIFEELKLIGISRYKQAYVIGRRALAQGKLRIESFTISCDVENLLATRGSLVRVSHDVPKIGSGWGKITSKNSSVITIEEDFTITSGSIYAYVRHADGTQTSHQLQDVDGNQAVITNQSVVEVGDLIIYGELNRVTLDCLVKAVRPSSDLTATLELTPYAPGIYTAEVDAIPPRNPWGSDWTGGGAGGGTGQNTTTPGQVNALKGTYIVTYESKTPRISVTLSWSKPSMGGNAFRYKIYFEDTNGWRLLGETTDTTYKAFNEFVFTDANGDPIDLNGKSLKFAVSGVGFDNSSFPPETSAQVTITPSVANPSAAITLTAVGGFFENVLTWSYSNTGFDVAFVEIFANQDVNDRSLASLIATVTVPATTYSHTGLEILQVWYYWIRLSDGKGNYSSWFPASATGGVQCSPSSDPSKLLDILFDAINTDQIAEDLNARIDLIDVGNNPAYPEIPNGLIAKVNVHDGDINTLYTETDTIANNVLDAAVLIDKHENMITGAGIYVDEGTGNVHIYGVDNLQGQLNLVEADLDAANAQISLRATQAYVDQAIVNAVIDPSQIAELDDLYARVSTVEVDLDAAETSISLKANLTTVNGIDARLSTAEIDIDALEGEIVTKVSNTEFDDLGARVTTAEETLSTVNGAEITRTAEDVRYLFKEQDKSAEAVLRNLFTEQKDYNLNQQSIAYATDTLRAYTDGKTLAEAEARLALGAALGTTDAQLAASIVDEQTARVTADAAEATARQELAAQITSDLATVTGSIVEEASIRLAADEAEAAERQALQVTVNGVQAALTNESIVRANADSAEALARTTLAARLDSDISDVSAYIISEQNARVSADEALASDITSLTAVVGSNTSAIQNEATARANADSALTTTINTVSATASKQRTYRQPGQPSGEVFNGDIWFDTDDNNKAYRFNGASWDLTDDTRIATNTAAIQTEATARANGDSANATSISTVQARLNTGDFAAVKVESSANASAITGINAKWGVQVQAGGRVSGISLNSGSTTYSSFTVLADVFNVYHPSDGTPRQMFGMGYVNGAYRVGINGSLIVDGSITANRLSVSQLSSITANIGTITSGLLRNSTNTSYLNLGATGTSRFLQCGSNVQINADGSGYFARQIVSQPNIIASGSADVGWSGWIPYETPGPYTRYIDTGVNVPGGWTTASTNQYLATVTISSGISQNGGGNGYTSAEIVIGDGLLSGGPNSPIDNRIYIKFTFEWGNTSGGAIGLGGVTWKLCQV